MASGLVWQGAQSRIIPYIVEVDEAGSVRAVGPVSDKFRPSDAQITNQLARFITNVRSISIDGGASGWRVARGCLALAIA